MNPITYDAIPHPACGQTRSSLRKTSHPAWSGRRCGGICNRGCQNIRRVRQNRIVDRHIDSAKVYHPRPTVTGWRGMRSFSGGPGRSLELCVIVAGHFKRIRDWVRCARTNRTYRLSRTGRDGTVRAGQSGTGFYRIKRGPVSSIVYGHTLQFRRTLVIIRVERQDVPHRGKVRGLGSGTIWPLLRGETNPRSEVFRLRRVGFHLEPETIDVAFQMDRPRHWMELPWHAGKAIGRDDECGEQQRDRSSHFATARFRR